MQNKNEKGQISVLLVDGDEFFLHASKGCLELQGELKIETATSSEEALSKIETGKKFDVVICGLPISASDCLEFLKNLRNDGITIPFIVFSIEDDIELIVKAFQLGANGFIGKYGDPEVVYATLKRCIEDVVQT